MTEPRSHPLSSGDYPSWAWGWGKDRFGVFAEIKVGEAIQRLRWIFPGTFQMGSPTEEAGRLDWEWPPHQVRLTEGFWLGETPCTQAFWQAVMGENPSGFQTPDRPVEQVSWEDCQEFFSRLDEWLPGFGGRLPTEAQWEYACRAGTEEATWAGDLKIRGERDAPLLDAIAWYGGNSGVDFDLPEGYDSSDWKEKQYPHTQAGTRRVKAKAPNPWGLYDMLGNVFEWCSDAGDYESSPSRGACEDPEGQDGARRVIRGGSWNVHARYVRAACRFWYGPGYRYDYFGFRLSRGPSEPGQAR